MPSKFIAGYVPTAMSLRFDNQVPTVYGAPVSSCTSLFNFPCYRLRQNELGEYLFVITNNTVSKVTTPNEGISSLVSEVPAVYSEDGWHAPAVGEMQSSSRPLISLDDIMLLEYSDAYYFVLRSEGHVKCTPYAINVNRLHSQFSELHVYVTASLKDPRITVAIYTRSNSDIGLARTKQALLDNADYVASMCLRSGVLLDLNPNPTGYVTSDNDSYIRTMGSVDLWLESGENTADSVVSLCKSALSGFTSRVTGFVPTYDQMPSLTGVDFEPRVLRPNTQLPALNIARTYPADNSLAYYLHNFDLLDLESDILDYGDEITVSDNIEKRKLLLFAAVIASQKCSYAGSVTQGTLVEEAGQLRLENDSDIQSSVSSMLMSFVVGKNANVPFEELFDTLLAHNFAFPDALGYYLQAGIVLDIGVLSRMSLILSGNYGLAAYDVIAERFNTPTTGAQVQALERFSVGMQAPGRVTSVPYGMATSTNALLFTSAAYTGLTNKHVLPSVYRWVHVSGLYYGWVVPRLAYSVEKDARKHLIVSDAVGHYAAVGHMRVMMHEFEEKGEALYGNKIYNSDAKGVPAPYNGLRSFFEVVNTGLAPRDSTYYSQLVPDDILSSHAGGRIKAATNPAVYLAAGASNASKYSPILQERTNRILFQRHAGFRYGEDYDNALLFLAYNNLSPLVQSEDVGIQGIVRLDPSNYENTSMFGSNPIHQMIQLWQTCVSGTMNKSDDPVCRVKTDYSYLSRWFQYAHTELRLTQGTDSSIKYEDNSDKFYSNELESILPLFKDICGCHYNYVLAVLDAGVECVVSKAWFEGVGSRASGIPKSVREQFIALYNKAPSWFSYRISRKSQVEYRLTGYTANSKYEEELLEELYANCYYAKTAESEPEGVLDKATLYQVAKISTALAPIAASDVCIRFLYVLIATFLLVALEKVPEAQKMTITPLDYRRVQRSLNIIPAAERRFYTTSKDKDWSLAANEYKPGYLVAALTMLELSGIHRANLKPASVKEGSREAKFLNPFFAFFTSLRQDTIEVDHKDTDICFKIVSDSKDGALDSFSPEAWSVDKCEGTISEILTQAGAEIGSGADAVATLSGIDMTLGCSSWSKKYLSNANGHAVYSELMAGEYGFFLVPRINAIIFLSNPNISGTVVDTYFAAYAQFVEYFKSAASPNKDVYLRYLVHALDSRMHEYTLEELMRVMAEMNQDDAISTFLSRYMPSFTASSIVQQLKLRNRQSEPELEQTEEGNSAPVPNSKSDAFAALLAKLEEDSKKAEEALENKRSAQDEALQVYSNNTLNELMPRLQMVALVKDKLSRLEQGESLGLDAYLTNEGGMSTVNSSENTSDAFSELDNILGISSDIDIETSSSDASGLDSLSLSDVEEDVPDLSTFETNLRDDVSDAGLSGLEAPLDLGAVTESTDLDGLDALDYQLEAVESETSPQDDTMSLSDIALSITEPETPPQDNTASLSNIVPPVANTQDSNPLADLSAFDYLPKSEVVISEAWRDLVTRLGGDIEDLKTSESVSVIVEPSTEASDTVSNIEEQLVKATPVVLFSSEDSSSHPDINRLDTQISGYKLILIPKEAGEVKPEILGTTIKDLFDWVKSVSAICREDQNNGVLVVLPNGVAYSVHTIFYLPMKLRWELDAGTADIAELRETFPMLPLRVLLK